LTGLCPFILCTYLALELAEAEDVALAVGLAVAVGLEAAVGLAVAVEDPRTS
jgi:hypothetical protein